MLLATVRLDTEPLSIGEEPLAAPAVAVEEEGWAGGRVGRAELLPLPLLLL